MVKKNMSVAEFIGATVDMSPKKQKEIAEEMGYKNPNVITMLKQGTTKLPPSRIPAFAKAVGVDPVRALDIVMSEYHPEMWESIKDIIGNPMTENESAIIDKIRKVTGNTDPKVANRSDAVKLTKDKLTLILSN